VRASENFIFFARNPLKSPESAKEIQGNPSIFPWNSLVFLGFIWRELARWLNPGPAAARYGRAKKAQMDRPEQRRGQRPAELIDSQKGSHQS
jgi:hypothetical protein